MKVHERLLKAYWSHDVPDQEMLELTEPIENTTGEERIALQDRLAEYIETHYPYIPGREPKGED